MPKTRQKMAVLTDTKSIAHTKEQINSVHQRIIAVLRRHASGNPELRVEDGRNGAKTTYSIFPKVHSPTAERNDGSLISVMQLKDAPNHWFHWYEAWVAAVDSTNRLGLFRPDQLSLSFYYGEMSDPRKMSLFRAEWDHFDDGMEPHRTPQPHWNIDHAIPMELRQRSLETIEPIPEQFFAPETNRSVGLITQGRIVRYHLGMRVLWESQPQTWRSRFVSGFGEQVEGWLELCLKSMECQLRAYSAQLLTIP